jgi:hypothetical protein
VFSATDAGAATAEAEAAAAGSVRRMPRTAHAAVSLHKHHPGETRIGRR